MHTGGVAPGEIDNVADGGDVVIDQVDTKNKWHHLAHLKLFTAWMFYVSLGVVMLGFDWSCYPQLLAMPTFAEKYGHWDKDAGLFIVPSGRQGAWNGSSSGAQVLGGFLSGFIMDKIGRRWWLFSMAALGMVSIGVVYAADDWKVLTVGRALQGFSIGSMTTFSPVYIGENATPELRGFFLVSFNTFIVVGQFLITLVCRGTVNIASEWQYKIPILTMFIYPSIVLLLFPLFPESPYYLYKKGDIDGARKATYRLYGKDKHDIVEDHMARVKHSIETGKLLMHVRDGNHFLDVFKGANLKRSVAAIFAAGAQQFCGVVFVVGYIPYFLTLVGFTKVFNWSMYLFTINLLGNIASFWTVEHFGRRKFCVFGLLILGVTNLIIGGLNVDPTHGKLLGTIALIYIWAAVYQMTIGALGFTLASEVATVSLRSETQSLVTVANAGFGWVFSFSIPYMINPDAANLGGKIGFIFGSFGVVCFIIGFFLFPETKGLTFSELDWLYSNKIPVWRFISSIKEQRESGSLAAGVHEVSSLEREKLGSKTRHEEVASSGA